METNYLDDNTRAARSGCGNCCRPSDTQSGVPSSVSVSESAHRFWLLLASVTYLNPH